MQIQYIHILVVGVALVEPILNPPTPTNNEENASPVSEQSTLCFIVGLVPCDSIRCLPPLQSRFDLKPKPTQG